MYVFIAYTAVIYTVFSWQNFSRELKRKPVYNFSERRENVAGQNDRQSKKVTGQQEFLVGHCPLNGRYFELCLVSTFLHVGRIEISSGLLPTRLSSIFLQNPYRTVKTDHVSNSILEKITCIMRKFGKKYI